MIFIDTHAHLYLDAFSEDRASAVERAVDAGVEYMLLPNVDEETIDDMQRLQELFPRNCLPMMGLHPTSVKPGFEKSLDKMKELLQRKKYIAVGETGIDLYWDKTFFDLQVSSFKTQIGWALEFDIPVVIHSRNSISEIIDILEPFRNSGLKGVMHCFPGDIEQAKWFIDFGFFLGIGGVVTYKNSITARVVENVPVEKLLLETDAPYLPPVPFRGKRNEPAYIPHIAGKIADIRKMPVEEIARITTDNAKSLFNLR
jgi:TatD DNase family protein